MKPALAPLLGLLLVLPPRAEALPGDRPAPPSPQEGTPGADAVTAEHQGAIDRGLAWLASRQNEDGAFPTVPDREDEGSRANVRSGDYQTAVTSLCLLSFLGAGHGLRHGQYRTVVGKAVGWLLRAQEGQRIRGYVSFAGDNQSRMHGHGYATLALAEAYGTAASRDRPGSEGSATSSERLLSERLRAGIEKAVACIEASQDIKGGWGYTPDSGGRLEHEGSVTVCQVQALQAASARGFRVGAEGIRKARQYMKDSQTATGAFRYRLTGLPGEDAGGRDNHRWALAAAGVTALLGLNEYDRKDAIDRGIAFLSREDPHPNPERTDYFFYGGFYAVQAYHWVGGDRWERFWPRLRGMLLGRQEEDGSWRGKDTAADLGRAYPTALTLLMLEVPVGYLGAFSR